MTPNPTSGDSFFVAGGTLKASTPSYVKRPTDDELFEAVLARELCYVLTPRQMGKSSLMIRTSRKLEEQSIRTAIIDLTKIGTQVTVQQWYTSLLMQMSRSLRLDADAATWVRERESAGYVLLFTDFIEQIVLPQIQNQAVIFIDEIDSTLGLDFRDDFFAGIRSLYNARAEKPELERITFVMLGVASPSELISDTARTPFNIGHSIALKEFSLEEADVLELGLESRFPSQGKRILGRIFYWTSGHPYLTQKLCKTIAEGSEQDWPDQRIDELVKELFLAEQARKETNLKFIQDRILQSDQRNALLKLYQRTLTSAVRDDGQSILQNQLKLSGLLTVENGYVIVRNRIYKTVFNKQWVRENLPKDWQRYAVIALGLVVSAFIAIFIYDSWIGIQVDRCSGPFYSVPARERVVCLARIFNQKGVMQNRSLEYRAYDLFYKALTKDQQLNLFTDYREFPYGARNASIKDDPGLQKDLVIVIRNLYTTLANVDEDTNSTPLLEDMSHALAFIPSQEGVALKSEIDFWIAGRKQFVSGQYQEALDSYNQSIQVFNANPATLYERAMTLIALGKYPEALTDLDNVMAIAENSPVPTATVIPTIFLSESTAIETNLSPDFTNTEAVVPLTSIPVVPETSSSNPTEALPKGTPIQTSTLTVTLTPTITFTPTQTLTLTPTATVTLTLGPIERLEADFISYIDRRNAVMDLLVKNPHLLAELIAAPNNYPSLKKSGLDLLPTTTPTFTSTMSLPNSTLVIPTFTLTPRPDSTLTPTIILTSTKTLTSLPGVISTDFPSPSIYVRSSPELPDNNSNIVGAVSPGDQVIVTGYTYAGWLWYRIDVPSRKIVDAWISGAILLSDKVFTSVQINGNRDTLPYISFPTPTLPKGAVFSAAVKSEYLRSCTNADEVYCSKLAGFSSGDKVVILNKNRPVDPTWYWVRINDKYGWVYKDWIDLNQITSTITSIPASEATPTYLPTPNPRSTRRDATPIPMSPTPFPDIVP